MKVEEERELRMKAVSQSGQSEADDVVFLKN